MRPAATAAAPAAAAGAATVATATAATPQAKHSGAHSEGGAPSSPSSPPRGMEFGVTYTGRINTDRSTKYCSIVVDPAADGTRRASVSIPTRKVPKSAKKGSAVSFVLKPHPSGGDGRSVVHDLVVLDAGKADGGSNSNTIVGALATADATAAAAKSAASAKAEVEEPVPVEKLLTADPRERLGGVFRWRSDRHFGFITRDDGKPPVYCSAHDVDVKINDGEHVSFAVALDTRYDDKVKAIGVRKGSVAKLSDVAKLVITAATNPQQLAAAGYLVGRLVDVCATRAHIMTDANVAFPLNRSCFDEFPCCKNADKLTFWQPGTAVLFKPSANSSFDVAVAFPASWSTVGIIIEASPTESHVQCRQTGLRFACDSPLIRSYGPLDRVTFVVGLETAKVDNGGAALKLVVRDIRVPSATSRVFRFVANGILQGPFTNHGTKAIVKIDRSTIVAAASNPKSTAADGATAPVDGEADADADDAEAVEVTVSAPVYTEADVPDELPVPISAFGAPEDNWKEGTPVTVGLRVFRRGGETGIAITFCRVKRSEPASV